MRPQTPGEAIVSIEGGQEINGRVLSTTEIGKEQEENRGEVKPSKTLSPYSYVPGVK